jgi:hypothetical protein
MSDIDLFLGGVVIGALLGWYITQALERLKFWME